MAEEAFEERGTDYIGQETVNNTNMNGVHDISTRLMARMLGLEVPCVDRDPSSPYYLLQSRGPFMSSQPLSQHLSYPSSAGFTTDMQTVNPVAMTETGETGGNWAANVAAPGSYGMNHLNYNMYDFGGYGV